MITRKNKIRRGKKSKKNKTLVGGASRDTSMIGTLQRDQLTNRILRFYDEFNDRNIPDLLNNIDLNRGKTQSRDVKTSPVDSSGNAVLTDVNKINEDKKVLNKSSILVCAAHGIIDDDYMTVPPNTIICYMSPMPYVNNIISELYFEYMNSLDVNQFKQLLTYRTFNRNVRLIHRFGYFGCLKNSIWYYPGQKAPNTKLVIFKKEYVKERQFYFEYTRTKKGLIRKSNSLHKEDLFPQIFKKPHLEPSDYDADDAFEFSMVDVLSNLNIRPGGFRLLLFDSCRCFGKSTSYPRQKEMIELELFYSRLNAINDKKALDLAKNKPNPKKIKFEGNFCFLSSHNEDYIVDKDKLDKLKFETNLKKYCYHSQTEHLIKMTEHFKEVSSISKFDKNAFGYLAIQSTMKLLKFFSTDDMSKLGPEKIRKILTGLFTTISADRIKKIFMSFDYFKAGLHALNFKNVEVLKHYLDGIHYLFHFLDSHNVDMRLTFMRKLKEFVDSYENDILIQYVLGNSLPTILGNNSTKIVSIQDLDSLSPNVLNKHLTFNFDFLQSIKGIDKYKTLEKLKGFTVQESISIANISVDGEIENGNLETLYLKSQDPRVYYKINCIRLKKLDIRGLQFELITYPILNKISLTKTELDISALYFTRLNLTDISLTDVTCNVNKLFDMLEQLKMLKNIFICGLVDNSSRDTEEIINMDFVRHLLHLDYLHISSMPTLKIEYINVVNSIPPTRIKKILIEFKGVDAVSIPENPRYTLNMDEYKQVYEKLLKSIV